MKASVGMYVLDYLSWSVACKYQWLPWTHRLASPGLGIALITLRWQMDVLYKPSIHVAANLPEPFNI